MIRYSCKRAPAHIAPWALEAPFAPVSPGIPQSMGNDSLKFFHAGNHSFTGIVNHTGEDLRAGKNPCAKSNGDSDSDESLSTGFSCDALTALVRDSSFDSSKCGKGLKNLISLAKRNQFLLTIQWQLRLRQTLLRSRTGRDMVRQQKRGMKCVFC